MKLLVDRFFKGEEYTIGRLYINNVYFSNTLEDPVRRLTGSKDKIYGKTAIPAGTYIIDMNTVSPKFSKYNQYKFCNGMLPRLMNVPYFEGVLIHIGNTNEDTDGCILVGINDKKGMVTQSTLTFKKLYKKMRSAADRGEPITIEIK